MAGSRQWRIVYRGRRGKFFFSISALAVCRSRCNGGCGRGYMGDRDRSSLLSNSALDLDRSTRGCRVVRRRDVSRYARWNWRSHFHRLHYVSRRVDNICRGISYSGRIRWLRHRFAAWSISSASEMVRSLQHGNGTDSPQLRYDYSHGRRLAMVEQRRGERGQLRFWSINRSGLLPFEPMITNEMR